MIKSPGHWELVIPWELVIGHWTLMKHPQLVVYESDGALAGQVRRLAGENSWLVRECRRSDACLELVSESRPSVLLLKLERDLQDGLTLLAQTAERAPDCPVVLVSDVQIEGAQ